MRSRSTSASEAPPPGASRKPSSSSAKTIWPRPRSGKPPDPSSPSGSPAAAQVRAPRARHQPALIAAARSPDDREFPARPACDRLASGSGLDQGHAEHEKPTRTAAVTEGEHTAKGAAGCSRSLPIIYGLQLCEWHRLVTRRSACSGAACRCCVAGLAGGCLPGREPHLMWQRQMAWRAAGRVGVLRCGEGDQAWWMVLVAAGRVGRDDGARPRGLTAATRPGMGCLAWVTCRVRPGAGGRPGPGPGTPLLRRPRSRQLWR